MEVSLNELHSIRECTLGDLCVHSANFWAKNPPRDAPNRWTWRFTWHRSSLVRAVINVLVLFDHPFLYCPYSQDCNSVCILYSEKHYSCLSDRCSSMSGLQPSKNSLCPSTGSMLLLTQWPNYNYFRTCKVIFVTNFLFYWFSGEEYSTFTFEFLSQWDSGCSFPQIYTSDFVSPPDV